MKTKRILLLAALLAVTSYIVLAQVVGSFTLPATTFGVETNTTGSDAIDILNKTTVYAYVTATGSNAACTHDVTFVFAASPNGTTYTTDRTDWKTALTLNGTTAASKVCTINMAGARYLKVSSIENPGSASTNGIKSVAVYYFYKP